MLHNHLPPLQSDMLQLLDFNVAFQADAVGLPSPMPQTIFTTRHSSQALLLQFGADDRPDLLDQKVTVVVCLVDPHYKPVGLTSICNSQVKAQVQGLIQAFLRQHPQITVLKACQYSPCFKGSVQAKFLSQLAEDPSVALAYTETALSET